jgi:preprotein translocase subunit SecB
METKNAPKSKFKFKGYLIKDSRVTLSNPEISEGMNAGIRANAEIRDNNIYELSMDVHVEDKDKHLCIDVAILGTFEFETSNYAELEGLLSMNAPAIMFPYIRAYISNVTALGGIKPIIMPTLNMIGIGRQLKEELHPIILKMAEGYK